MKNEGTFKKKKQLSFILDSKKSGLLYNYYLFKNMPHNNELLL